MQIFEYSFYYLIATNKSGQYTGYLKRGLTVFELDLILVNCVDYLMIKIIPKACALGVTLVVQVLLSNLISPALKDISFFY